MRASRALLVGAAALFASACEGSQHLIAPAPTDAGGAAVFAKQSKGDPHCKTKSLKRTQKGKIKANGCLFTESANGQREDLYTFAGAGSNQMMTFTANAAFSGIFGVTDTSDVPFAGTVWGYQNFDANTPTAFSVIGSNDEYGMFVSGGDSTQLGKYTVSTSVGAPAYSCDALIFLQGTVTFGTALDGGNSCHETIEFTPYPPALGQPIWTHNFYAKVIGGHSYTVHVDGLTGTFQVALTIFGGGVVAQDVGDVTPRSTRDVTFTAPYTRYVLVELASGRFVGGAWALESGSYSLTFTSD
jgi:hypothetical protein